MSDMLSGSFDPSTHSKVNCVVDRENQIWA